MRIYLAIAAALVVAAIVLRVVSAPPGVAAAVLLLGALAYPMLMSAGPFREPGSVFRHLGLGAGMFVLAVVLTSVVNAGRA